MKKEDKNNYISKFKSDTHNIKRKCLGAGCNRKFIAPDRFTRLCKPCKEKNW